MDRLVVVSNRVPLPSSGQQAGGLAVALDGLMAKRGGLWFGWSGRVAQGAHSADPMIESAGAVDYVTVDLTQDEHDRYYNNFSNGVLWPLLHTMPELMRFDRRDARSYAAVNTRLAATLAKLLRPSDLIWVHDYHLLLLPAALRALGVTNPIGFFLHIPFAAPDVLAAAPEVANLVRDLLAADLIGFQTDNDMANFAAAAQTLAGAVRLSASSLMLGGRRIRLGVFPVEIEAHSFARMAAEMECSESSERLRRSLDGQALILGIDRLDPTKGLMQRLGGLRALLEKHPAWNRRVTMLQIAAMSRKDVGSYRSLRDALDSEAGCLNADIGEPDWSPLRLVSKASLRPTVSGFMRLARVGLVTPLRDGMNLVAKEFVAAQNPADPGVLILSRFAGAARQLDAALLVNPHDADAMADAMDTALTMGLAERQTRWRALWAAIENRSPVLWGRSFVASLLRARASAGRQRIPLERFVIGEALPPTAPVALPPLTGLATPHLSRENTTPPIDRRRLN
ncbi:MAG: trehalose-6-phosphate synthase [Rhodospirillales bacterium]|nr:trehalose-6-phosphate synthase [Rhodospirillales bacterium]